MSQLIPAGHARGREGNSGPRTYVAPAFAESVTERLRHRTLYPLPDARQRGTAGFPAGSVVYTLKAETCMIFDDRLPFLYLTEPRADHFLARHLDGDWGEVPPEIAAANRRALETRVGRVTSMHLMDTSRTPYAPDEWTPMIVMTELQGGSTVFFVEQDLLAR